MNDRVKNKYYLVDSETDYLELINNAELDKITIQIFMDSVLSNINVSISEALSLIRALKYTCLCTFGGNVPFAWQEEKDESTRRKVWLTKQNFKQLIRDFNEIITIRAFNEMVTKDE